MSEQVQETYFGSPDEFFREYLRWVYQRRIRGDGRTTVWAAEWWRYEEAVIRIEALWRSWEQMRLDPATGISAWLRDHADYHMAVLMDPEGPFAGAEGPQNSSDRGEPLPYQPPPEGLFPADQRPSDVVPSPAWRKQDPRM